MFAKTVELLNRVHRGSALRKNRSLVAAVGLCLLLHVFTTLKYPAVDVQDEIYYLDHVVKVSEFRLGQPGDFFSQKSIDEICFRNGQVDHPMVPTDYSSKCQSRNPQDFGVNYTAPMPVYFVVTGLSSRLLYEAFGLAGRETSIVTIARLLSALWFAIGIIICAITVKRLGVSTSLVAPLCIGVAGLSMVLHQQTIINADASSFALGGLLVLMVVRYIQRDSGSLALAASVLFVSLATNHHLVITAAVLFFLFQRLVPALRGRLIDDDARRNILGILIVAGGGVVSVLWNRGFSIFGHLIYGNPDTDPTPIQEALAQQYKGNGFHWSFMFSPQNMTSFLVPHWDGFPPAQRFGGPYQTAAWLTAMLLLGGVVWGCLGTGQSVHVRQFAVSHTIAAFLMPIVFIANWNSQGVNDGVVSRFAISSFVLLIIVSCEAFSERQSSRRIVWLICWGTFAVAMATNFTAVV